MPSADGCSYDSDGRPSCAVKSEGSDSDTGILSAEFDATPAIEVRFKDTADAKAALDETLKFNKGDCGAKLTSVFSKLKNIENPNLGYDNDVRDSDLSKLFDDLAGQKEGGFFFNFTTEEIKKRHPNAGAGGSGAATTKAKDGKNPANGSYAYVYLIQQTAQTYDFNRNRSLSMSVVNNNIAGARNKLVSVLIHEMAHAAGKNTTFGHQDLDFAALTVAKELGVTLIGSPGNDQADYFNDFVKKYCGVSLSK